MKKVAPALLLLFAVGFSFGVAQAASCPLPLVELGGVCVVPTRPCVSPPKNVLPESCIDAVENGMVMERVYFNCLPGYFRTGRECLNPCPSPYILSGGECRNPFTPCIRPPEHSLPLSCFDKTENGARTERFMFACEEGYEKNNGACQSFCPAGKTFYQNQCVEENQACLNPPAKAKSGTCHDRIVNGIRKERENFECVESAKKEEKECVDRCDPGKTFFRGYCVEPDQPCADPPEHAVVGSCRDLIENEQLIKRVSFLCEEGYRKQEKECVSACEEGKTEMNGACVPAIRYCRNWPENAAACMDLVTEGIKKEQALILCLPGFEKNGNRCIRRTECEKASSLAECQVALQPCAENPENASPFTCQDLVSGTARTPRYRFGCPLGFVRGEEKCVPSAAGIRKITVKSPLQPLGFDDPLITEAALTLPSPFPDAWLGTLAGKAAAELYYRGVVGGYPDGKFKGGRKVNRAEAAKFILLARFNGATERAYENIFPDVSDRDWFSKYIAAAASEKLISGYPDGYYRPGNTVNTAEFLKIFVKAFGLEENMSYSYSDVKPSDWFARYAGAAQRYEIFPDRANLLDPSREITRNEVVVAIYQYLKNR